MEQNQIIQLIQKNHPFPKIDRDKILKVLFRKVKLLKKQIEDIKSGKFIDSLQFTKEQLKKDEVSKIPYRLKTEKGWRPLLDSEIDEAQSATDNSKKASEYLGVSYRTYRKWCLFYGKWKTNPWRKGSKKKHWNPNDGKYPLNQILEGKFPNYSIKCLKNSLFRTQIKKAECEVCGFNERRIIDEKMPLLVNFKDGDEKNHKLENLQILCYNHYFLQGRGYIRNGKVEFSFENFNNL